MRLAVIGAGPAGLVVARRLADAGHRVEVFEAGPNRRPLEPRAAALDWVPGLDEADRLVGGLLVERTVGRPASPYRQGRGVGGGAAVNGMVLDTPPIEHAMWGSLTADEVGDALASVDARLGPGHHPAAGPLGAAMADLADALDGWSARPARLAAADGRRLDLAEVWGVHQHPEITVHADRAIAELAGLGTEAARVDAAVVCAGALGTPALLAGSGAELPDPLPGLADHPSIPLTVALRPEARSPAGDEVAPATTLIDLDATRTGTGSGRGSAAHLYVMDHLGADRHLGLVQLALLAPRSRGEIPQRGAPRFRLLTDPADRDDLRTRLRRLVAAMAAGLGGELGNVAEEVMTSDGTPAIELAALDDDALDAWLLGHLGAHAHAAASLGLGHHLGDDGEVPGLPGVFVADSSAFAVVPPCNPMLATLTLADAVASRLVARFGR